MLSDEELDACIELWRGVPKWEQVAEQAREANSLRQRVSDLIANANAREIDVNRLRANIERALQAIKEADAAAENRGLPIEGYTRQAIARALEALSK